MERHSSKRNESINVDKADNTTLGTKGVFSFPLPELSTVIKGFNEFINILDGRSFPKKSKPSLVKLLWLFFDILFL